jgi:predicted phosphodiesterase
LKIAIFSDIHSNIEALTACHEHALSRGAEIFACLGDSVGYGPDPDLVLDKLSTLPGLIAIMGNHDEGVCGLVPYGTAEHASSVFEWTREKVSIAHMDWLMSLPDMAIEYDATFVHASAYRPKDWTYVDNDRDAQMSLAHADTAITFIGHTHLPVVYSITPLGVLRCRRPVDGEYIFVGDGDRHLINVGSVGQPRDLNNNASYAIYDTERLRVQCHRVPYNFRRTMRKINDAKLPKFLADRLEDGR